ncbi:FecR family protein [Brytella acorum]|uniref:FecR family protein n=1 Tax=Brytella acorum TaxID=2959299 RepID=UPI0025AE0981|nr:FecR family protein [Brytella acorum]MDF3625962.1 FecR family protein [Brytella acorum]
MTDNSAGSGDELTSEANLWVIRLTEEPDDPALRREFSAWHARSLAHAEAWSRALRVWKLTGALAPALFSLPDHDRSTAPRQPPVRAMRSAKPFRRYAVGAGLATALCGAALFFLPGIRIALQADYTTPIGQDRSVTLADGSVVTLGAQSAIAVHYRPEARSVTLLSGEAFFVVRHDEHRPFTVSAGTIRARDIGTRFDVRLDSSQIRVGVQEGVVGISSEGDASELHVTAGEEIRLDRSTRQITRLTMTPEAIGSWTTGTLVIEDDTIGQVVDLLRRYYPGFIVTWGDALRTRHVGGVYDLHNIPAALRAAVVPSGGHVLEIGGTILIVTGADPQAGH